MSTSFDMTPLGSIPTRRDRTQLAPAGLRPVLIVLMVALALVLGGGTNSTPTVRAAELGTVATDVLNLRDAPGTWGDVLTTMVWGETVEILSGPTDDGWYELAYGGYVGWAAGEYLSIGGVGGGGERWIDVDRSTGTVTLYDGGAVVATYWAALGWDTSDDGYYATAIGTYYVHSMDASLVWSEPGQVYFTHWIGFDPERANGFHSWSMDEEGNVIPGGDGPTGGCVALEPSAAAEVYAFAEIGMRVEIHW
jgi:hypothetical protein